MVKSQFLKHYFIIYFSIQTKGVTLCIHGITRELLAAGTWIGRFPFLVPLFRAAVRSIRESAKKGDTLAPNISLNVKFRIGYNQQWRFTLRDSISTWTWVGWWKNYRWCIFLETILETIPFTIKELFFKLRDFLHSFVPADFFFY